MTKHAILDIGTNTFHLLIVEGTNVCDLNILYHKSIPVKLKEGFANGQIADAPFQRAMQALEDHRSTLNQYGLDKVVAIGTAALRTSQNGHVVIEEAKKRFDIDIHVISGDQEAELIYLGVNSFDHLDENSLIIDIGGGSVEFIIGNGQKMHWKKSIPIGASVLKNEFQKQDPISPKSIMALEDHLQDVLEEMLHVAKMYEVKTMVGTSGSFETIYDILNYGEEPRDNKWSRFEIDVAKYRRLHTRILFSTQEERLAIKGMTLFRADMMVVGSILISYVLTNLQIDKVFLARTAIKEGLLWSILKGKEDQYLKN